MLAFLSLPQFAISASALSVSNASSCARDLSLVSCQTKVKVDPTSYRTCCYNGALQPGFKESGLVLSTQFWDTDPSTGPADSTSIHGEKEFVLPFSLVLNSLIFFIFWQDYGQTTVTALILK